MGQISSFPIETADSASSSATALASLEAVPHLIKAANTYGAFGITVADGTGVPNPSGVVTLTMTGNGGDDLLTPPEAPQPLTGGNYNGYQMIPLVEIGSNGELSVVGNELIVSANGAGEYSTTEAYVGMSSDINNNTAGFVFALRRGGQYLFTQRVVHQRMANGNIATNLSGGGQVFLQAGDALSLWGCAEKACIMSIYDTNIGVAMDIASELIT